VPPVALAEVPSCIKLCIKIQLALKIVKSKIWGNFSEAVNEGGVISLAKKKLRGVPKLGERIKSFMTASNLDASQLSARTDISTSYMSRIVNGEVVNPTIDFVMRIADGLGVTETELVRDEDVKGSRLVKVAGSQTGRQEQGSQQVSADEDEDGEDEEAEELENSTAVAARGIPDSLFDPIGEKIKEIKRLIDSVSLTDEQGEVVASHLDTLKRLLKFFEAQRKMRKEG
jgi:transcriptional regulator with XRE-family HTH domain